jgi:predicted DNA-binding WGR domain protein
MVLTLSGEGKNYAVDITMTICHIRWGKVVKSGKTKRWGKDYPHHQA